MNGTESRSHRQLDRFAHQPFWKSPLFFALATLSAIDLAYAAWVIERFWTSFPAYARFVAVFLLVTSPLILFGAIQQQRYIRRSNLTPHATPILALTFCIAAWSYALIGMVLRLLLVTCKPLH